jgi:Flp pilus assembly protein protease CpaA
VVVALRSIRRRPLGNALILLGVAAAAIGSAVSGLGAGGAAIGIAVAVLLLYAGFVAPSTARVTRPSRRANLPHSDES